MANDITKGFLIGVATTVAVPLIATALGVSGRPIARALLRSGQIVGEKTREAAAEFVEVTEDLLAEVRAEKVAQTHRSAAEASSPPPTEE